MVEKADVGSWLRPKPAVAVRVGRVASVSEFESESSCGASSRVAEPRGPLEVVALRVRGGLLLRR